MFGPGAGAGATPSPGGGAIAAGAPGAPRRQPARSWPRPRAELQTALGQVRAAQQSGDLGSLGQALSALDTAVKNFQTANGQTTGARAGSGRRVRAADAAAAPVIGQRPDLRRGPPAAAAFRGGVLS